jgi:hypothetical protein
MSLIKPRDGNATSGASLPRNFGVEVLQVLALNKSPVDRGPDGLDVPERVVFDDPFWNYGEKSIKIHV